MNAVGHAACTVAAGAAGCLQNAVVGSINLGLEVGGGAVQTLSSVIPDGGLTSAAIGHGRQVVRDVAS